MRKAIISAAVVMIVVSIAGFIISLVLNAFVLDHTPRVWRGRDPGHRILNLPAGDVTVSFHSQIIGSTGGGGCPFRTLNLTITPPPRGVAKPELIENLRSTTTVGFLPWAFGGLFAVSLVALACGRVRFEADGATSRSRSAVSPIEL